MNARKQILVLLTVLMLVCSSGAMVIGATAGTTVDEHDADDCEDEADAPDDTADDEQNDTADDEQDDADEANETSDNESEQQPAYVTFEDQESDGETVVVDEVSMYKGGFVTIHDSSLLAGDALGSVVGVSAFLEEGTHENVEVTLDEPLEEDETLIAMPHRDTNDNQEYDFVETEGEADAPYLAADDEPVTDEAVVTLADEAGADTADEPAEEEPNESVEEEPNESVEEEPNESVEEEPVEGESANEESAENESTEEPADNESVEDESVEEEPEAADGDAITVVIERADIFAFVEGLDEMPPGDGTGADDAADDSDGPSTDHRIEVTIEQPTVTPIGDAADGASAEESVGDGTIGQATVFVVVHEHDGAVPTDGGAGESITIERATIFVVVDDVQSTDETDGEAVNDDGESTDDEEAADDENESVADEDDAGDANATDGEQLTIEQATVFVVVQDGEVSPANGETAEDSDFEENGVDDGATEGDCPADSDRDETDEQNETDEVDETDEADTGNETTEDDAAETDDESEADTDEQRLEITIERATIFVVGDEAAATEEPESEPAGEEPVENDSTADEPTEDGPVEEPGDEESVENESVEEPVENEPEESVENESVEETPNESAETEPTTDDAEAGDGSAGTC